MVLQNKNNNGRLLTTVRLFHIPCCTCCVIARTHAVVVIHRLASIPADILCRIGTTTAVCLFVGPVSTPRARANFFQIPIMACDRFSCGCSLETCWWVGSPRCSGRAKGGSRCMLVVPMLIVCVLTQRNHTPTLPLPPSLPASSALYSREATCTGGALRSPRCCWQTRLALEPSRASSKASGCTAYSGRSS